MSANGWLHGPQNNFLAAGHRGLGSGQAAVNFIAGENPEAAARVGNALINRVTILENFPLIGSPYRKRPGVRKLVSRPYLIFYRFRETENAVDILRYWHGSRTEPDLRSHD